MATTKNLDLAAMKRGSRISALLTLIGAVIVLASIGYGMWRVGNSEDQLRDTNNQLRDAGTKLDAKHQELERAETALKIRNTEIGAKERQLAELKTQEKALNHKLEEYRHHLNEYQLQIEVARGQKQILQQDVREKYAKDGENVRPQDMPAMVSALVTPAATAKEIKPAPPDSPTGKWYEFTLKLKFPADMTLSRLLHENIASVTYELNHPYRPIKPLVSNDRANDYAATFNGAGTLNNVIVRITLKDKRTVNLDFDMSTALHGVPKK